MNRVGFRAYVGSGMQQVNFPSAQYAKPAFGAKTYDTSGRYDVTADRWVPVPVGAAPQIATFMGQVFIVGGAGLAGNPSNPTFVLKLVKNGVFGTSVSGFRVLASYTDCVAVISDVGVGLPGVCALQFFGEDLANAGDVYDLIMYATACPSLAIPFPASPGAAGTTKIDFNPAHVWWSGSVYQL